MTPVPIASGWLLNHLNLPVTDLEASLDFYVRKLPFRYLRHLHAGKVILKAASFDFFLEQHPRNVAHPNFHFGLQTTLRGVYEWQALLQRQGIPQVAGPQPTGRAETYVTPDGLRHVLYFADPDGHVIEIYSHIGEDVGYVDMHWA